MKKISALLLVLAIFVTLATFAACKVNEATFTVTFKNGEVTVDTKTVKNGECVTGLPKCPVDENMRFDGWYVGNNEFTTSTKVTGDVTVVAKISEKTSVENTFTVTFKNGEKIVDTKTVKNGECVTELPICEAENGMKFEGWFVGEVEFTVSTKVTSNLTATAKISVDENVDFTLTLKLNEDTVYETVSCKLNSKVDLYDYSVVDYEIHEWIDDDGNSFAYDELYIVKGNATLTAVAPVKLQFTMQLSDDGTYYIVTGLSDTTAAAATIPHTFFELPVKEIAPVAFAPYNNSLKELIVPDNIKKIGKEAFAGLCGIKELTVPFVGEELYTEITGNGEKALFAYWFSDSVSNDHRSEYAYGATVFYDGNGEEINENLAYATRYIPKSLTKLNINGGAIAKFAFHTIATIETVTLGDSVTALGGHAFGINPQNTEIRVEDFKLKNIICTQNSNIMSIGEGCFNNQINLKKVCLPPKVKIVCDQLFRGFEKLTDLEIFENSELEEIGISAFYGTAISSIRLPETVSTIGTFAFSVCNELKEISIAQNAINLGSGIFRGCENLVNVSFDPRLNITEIPAYTFAGCKNLVTVKLPASIVKFNEQAFNNCQSLSRLDDEEIGFEMTNVTYIGDSALAATAFRYIDISENITYIGSGAFASCSKLLGVFFNDTSDECKLTEIAAHAFDGCSNLAQITLPDSVTKIGIRSFSYTGLEKVELPANLQEIGSLAFYQFYSEDSAFTTVTDLGTLTSLTTIGDSAFENNGQLVIMSLPESITSIGQAAFRNTGINTTITLNPEKLIEIGANAFANCSNAIIEVIGANSDIPRKWNAAWAGSGVNATKVTFTNENTNYVPLFAQFEGYEENGIYYVTKYIGEDTEILLQNSFANKEVIYNQSVFAGNSTITAVTLASNMTTIPKNFFSECAELQTVTIPKLSKITSIGDYAFNKCYALTSLTITDASELTYIGDYAFYYAHEAAFIELTNNGKISYVGDYAFEMRLPTYNCRLTSLNLDLTKAEYIGAHAFSGCFDLVANYELTSSVEYIGESAFYGCSKIGLTLKEGFKIARFENKVFQSVSGLTWENVDFTDVEYIGDNAFSSTGALANVKIYIPNTITYIGKSAFHSAKLLGAIIDCNKELEICDTAFGYSASNFYLVIKGMPKKIGYSICSNTNRAHIYFTETLTASTTYPILFTLGDGSCEIDSLFYIYDLDKEHAINIPYFGKEQWTADENGEPIHPTDGHKESSSSGG